MFPRKRFKRAPKFAFFQRGQSMVFVKNGDFCMVFFMQNGSRKKFFMKFERENENFFDYKDIDFKKPQNLHFSKGVNPWFLSKIEIFPSFFCRKWIQKMRLVKLQKRAFLDYKNIDLKKNPNLHFSKGVSAHA